MEFLHLEADDYESALRLAREQWGSAVRVHTRRDIPTARGAARCRISFYLVDLSKQVRFDPEAHLHALLEANAIPAGLCNKKEEAWASLNTMQQAEVEVRLIETLFTPIDYATGLDRRVLHLIGEGASAMAPLLAVHHRAKEGERVAILNLAAEDLGLAEAAARYSLPLLHGLQEAELESLDSSLARYERVVLLAPDDGHLGPIDEREVTRILVTGPSGTRSADVDAVLVTDLESAERIGPLLAYLVRSKVAFAYVVDEHGELRRAASAALLSRLVGFSLDLEALSFA